MARIYAMGDTKVPMQISAVCPAESYGRGPDDFTFPKGQQAGAGRGQRGEFARQRGAALVCAERCPSGGSPANQAAGWHVAHGRRRRGTRLVLHSEWVARLGTETVWHRIGEVFALAIAAVLVYWGITSAIGIREARDFVALARNRR